MNRMLTIAGLALVALVCGCATNPQGQAQAVAAGEQTGTCEVCRYNHDLACVDFRMKDTTPHTEYHGRTYCFCSKTCQAAFQKNPAKYAHHDSSAEKPR